MTKNIIKHTFRIIFLVLCAIIISVYYTISLIDINEATKQAEQVITQTLGNEVKVNGKVKFGLQRLRPSVSITDITIKNTPNMKYENLFSVKRLVVSFSVIHILSGELKINRVFIDTPIVNYEKIKNKSNFDFAFLKDDKITQKESTKEVEKVSPINLELSNVNIKDLKVSIRKDKEEVIYNFENSKHYIKLSNNKTHLISQFEEDKKSYNTEIISSSVHDILNKEKDLYIKANIVWDKSNLNLNASVVDINKMTGASLKLNGKIHNIKEFLKDFDVAFIEMPTIDFDINASGSIDKINIKKAEFIIDDSQFTISGNVKNITKSRSSADIKITGKTINLPRIFSYENYDYSKYISNETPAYELEKREPKVFIDVPFPLALINKFDVNLDLKANKIMAMSTMPINSAVIKINLKNGVAIANPIRANYADGIGEVLLKADASSKKYLAVKTIIVGQNIKAGKVFQYAGAGDVLDTAGLAQVSAYLKGQGATLSQLMASLQGEVKINSLTEFKGYGLETYAVGKDMIKSTVDGVVDSIKGKKEKDLKIYCFAANLQIQDGVSESYREIAVQTDKVNIVATGLIDFNKEFLDVSIVPVPVASLGIDSADLISMLKISGPIAQPSISIAGDQLIKSAIKLGITTTAITVVSGGILLLPAIGVGYIANNWFKSITQDKSPCSTATKRKSADTTISYDVEIQEFLHELGRTEILEIQEGGNTKRNRNLVQKVAEEVIQKPITVILTPIGDSLNWLKDKTLSIF